MTMLPLPPPTAVRLRRDRRGAATIEFAILAGPLIALLLMVFEVGMMFFSQQALEQAADRAARRLRTGQVQKNHVGRSQFIADTCAEMPPVLRCSALHVDVSTGASFAAADAGRPTVTRNSSGAITNAWRYDTGAAGAIVITRLFYEWPVNVVPRGLLGDTVNGYRTLVATSIAKTEPYQ